MSILETIKTAYPELKAESPSQLPALNLAYIGDTVYDLYVRTFLVHRFGGNAHSLHLLSSRIVCAAGQAAAFHRMESVLTEEEMSVFKRGRNAHSATVPKNASITDYRTATGVETLIGYLYLNGRDDRLNILMKYATEELNNGLQKTEQQ